MNEGEIILAFKAGRAAGATGIGDNPFTLKGEPFHFSAWEVGYQEENATYSVTPRGEQYRNRERVTLAAVWPVEKRQEAGDG